MKLLIALLFLLCSLIPSLVATAHAGRKSDLITTYIPAFNGPSEIGQNVATVLNLQIWRTLRMAANNKTFGRGLVVWDTKPLNSQSFDFADELAHLGLGVNGGKRVYPQLVFWGNAREFGSGIVVECFLSIPPSYAEEEHGGWDITIPYSRGEFRIHADLPQRRYEFSPIVLKKELVEVYSKPTALQIFASRDAKVPIGTVGPKFEARQQLDGWVLLESDGKVGWVPLPKLSENRSEVVDFVGGVIRILRSDWDGANQLFERVVKNPKSPTTLKVDALLYQALAKTKAGQDARPSIELAHQLAPYYQTTTVYSVMAKLEGLYKLAGTHNSGKAKATIIREIEEELARSDQLFLPNDSWLSTVSNLLQAVS